VCVCVCVICVCVCVKNKYRDNGPPWIILMITKIHSERHKVSVYMITKIQRTTGTKNYGPLVNNKQEGSADAVACLHVPQA
jgi:hypothetical protein